METFDLRLWPRFVEAGGDISQPTFIHQICIDSRRISTPQSLFVALEGNQQDGHQFVAHAAQAGARYALVKKSWRGSSIPDSTLTILRVEDPLQAFQEIAALYRQQLPATTLLGITGSYGKTLLKDLLFALLSTTKRTVASPESFNSQIGVPLSLLTIRKEDEIAIIEAGISQKNEMVQLTRMIQPHCTILTNIGDAHLPTLKNLQTTASEKIQLLLPHAETKWALLPRHSLLQNWIPQLHPQRYFWNEEVPSLPHARLLSAPSQDLLHYRITFPTGSFADHQISSGFSFFLDLVNMAIKAAWLFGVSEKTISEVLKQYQLELMRTEIWRSPAGITFFNDPYCSDPQSVEVALRQLQQASSSSRRIFAFGGMRKKEQTDNDYRIIGKTIAKSQLDLLLLFGKHNFNPLLEEVAKGSPKTEICLAHSYSEAVEQMRKKLSFDDLVLIKADKKEPLENVIAAFNESICNNQCLIHLSAIKANLELLRARTSPDFRIMCMVKALAYGTDDIRMAKFLASCGIDILGVSYVDEGVSLRRSGVSQALFVVNAAVYEVSKVVTWELEVGVSDLKMIQALANEAAKQRKRTKVHLHVDTGMSRFGCRPEAALFLAKEIAKHPELDFEGIFTHFAAADDPKEDAFTFEQIRLFDQVIHQLEQEKLAPKWRHAANSSALVRFALPQYNMARIGLAVYGLYPSEAAKNALELRLALSLLSHIVGINVCKKGETISYGRSYKVTKDEQRIAVLPIGYFDGLHRNYSGKGEVVIRGKRAPMVGKICMDYMMVDVTDIPEAQTGDSVLIFGTDEHGNYLSPELLADKGNSIVYELITCLGPRIQRIFVNE